MSALSFPEFLASLLHTILRQSDFLPADFRSSLLLPEVDPPSSLPAEFQSHVRRLLACSSEAPLSVKCGVPVHPLFKYLAYALSEMLANSVFPRQVDLIPGLPYDHSLEEKIKIWTEQTIGSLAMLQKLIQRVKLDLHVKETLLAELRDLEKTEDALHVFLKYKTEDEPAIAIQNRRVISEGDFVLLNKTFLYEIQVLNKQEHACKTSEKVYEAILDNEDSINGIVMDIHNFQIVQPDHVFWLQALDEERQPLHIIKNILEVLGVDGIKALMGFQCTVGSVKDALSPGWATLLGSFLAFNCTDISGCKLTVGARALAKHVHRSISGWWGHFSGSDDVKNMLALDIITQIMENAFWLNVHFVPPDLHVFEIRVREGYGARWTADGSKFRGFLEPQMEYGHAKKWRH